MEMDFYGCPRWINIIPLNFDCPHSSPVWFPCVAPSAGQGLRMRGRRPRGEWPYIAMSNCDICVVSKVTSCVPIRIDVYHNHELSHRPIFFIQKNESSKSEFEPNYLMRSALLGVLVIPVPVDEGHREQRPPEDEICGGYHCGKCHPRQ